MTLNNLCNTLIVYGSHVPGGENHELFSGLPGEWRRGTILCNLIDPPDGIGPGESHAVEAWTIEFSDCRAEMFTPEYEVQERLLYERWTSLDRAMGPNWARNQTRWWPDGSAPIVGRNGMIVVNIYVPLQNFPYLADRDDVPAPDEEDDLHALWSEVKSGAKRYDSSLFIALIKDATPDQYEDLFCDLPNGQRFIRTLARFYDEHRLGNGNLLWDGESEYFSLYVCPLAKHALEQSALLDLVKTEIANRAALLRRTGFHKEAESVETLRFVFGEPNDPEAAGGRAADALSRTRDIIAESQVVEDRWFYCVKEACIGIAMSYGLAEWLMSHWYAVDFDFETTYNIWKGGGSYEVIGDICYVYRRSSKS